MGIKMSVGGKYAGVKREAGPGSSSTKREPGSGSSGVRREFIGSGVNSYKFERVDANGIPRVLTVRAHSVKEANQLAATKGFKTTDRKIKRRNKKRKK